MYLARLLLIKSVAISEVSTQKGPYKSGFSLKSLKNFLLKGIRQNKRRLPIIFEDTSKKGFNWSRFKHAGKYLLSVRVSLNGFSDV